MESERRKRIDVKFVSDQDVRTLFVDLKVKGLPDVKQTRNKRKIKSYENDDLENVSNVEVQSKPTSLFENGDVAGQKMFGFETPKRCISTGKKLSESNEKRSKSMTQKKVQSPMKLTPLSSKKLSSRVAAESSPLCRKLLAQSALLAQNSSPQRNQSKTPKSARKLFSVQEVECEVSACPSTPYNFRRRVKQNLAAAKKDSNPWECEQDDFSVSESDWDKSDASSDSSEEDSDEGDKMPEAKFMLRAGHSLEPSHSKNLKLSFIPAAEEYFQSHASKKILTSNNTLGKLRHNLPQEKLQKLLSETTSSHEKYMRKLVKNVISLFSKWHLMLREGFNVLLYGVGSKRDLLNAFFEQLQEPSVVVNGFFPSLTIQEIVSSISEDILGLHGPALDLLETVDRIKYEFSLRAGSHLYLFVHNIDGVMLRNDKCQEVLAHLSCTPNIHLIASIDHISAPLMWDQPMLSMFNFSWWDATSFCSYTIETAFESSLLVQQSGNLALSSLQNVFRSLTKNAQSIFLLMVNYQRDHKDVANYNGMPFKKLYTLCRESLLVSSDLALRSQLTEFLDHRLLKSRRGSDGSELLVIPVDQTILDQFISEQSS